MAIGDPYIDLAEIKDYLKIPASKQEQDESLEDALASSTHEIEQFCARQFNREAAATSRLFAPDYGYYLNVDDFYTADDLVVEVDTAGDGSFSTVIPETDYELDPANGVLNGRPGWPFYRIRLLVGGFPCNRRQYSVRVTAHWGWAEVPPPVKQACKIMAAETWKLKDAPFGVLGLDEFGIVRVRQNGMAMSKLAPYAKTRILIG